MSTGQDDYDSPWKNALEEHFEEFMALFFPAAYAEIDWSRPVEFLDKELQQVALDAETGRRYADKLAKVWKKSGEPGWVLAHVEVQGQPEEQFNRRVYTYNHMSSAISLSFGDLLKQLRKWAGMTQGDLAAVGYSVALVCALEQNRRLPDVERVMQSFVPALGLQTEPHPARQLVERAALARGERPPALLLHRQTQIVVTDEIAEPAPPLKMTSLPTFIGSIS